MATALNYENIPFKKLLKRKKQFMAIKKNRLDWLDLKIDSYLPFSNKEIHSYIKKNNLTLKFKTTQEYITFLKDKNNFISFSQFDSLIAEKMQKIKAFDLVLYKDKNLPLSSFYSLTGKYQLGFPSDISQLIINSKFIEKNYKQLYNNRLKMNIDILYLQYLYKLYKDGIEFFEKISETKKVLPYESFLDWLNLSIEKRTFFIINFKHILFMPLIYATAFSKVYFPWHLFLITSELNPLKSLIIANILNQFTKVSWMNKHLKVNEENEQNEIFTSYDQLKYEYKNLLPYFKENYNTKDKDIFETNKVIYRNFMYYIILDKTKIKIENLQSNESLDQQFIGYQDVKNEYDFYTSLVKNCKVNCIKDCTRELGRYPCGLKDYFFFGNAENQDTHFFDKETIFDKTKIEPNNTERTVTFLNGHTLTQTDNNVYLNKNKDRKEIIDEIEEELKILKESFDEIEEELKKLEENKNLKKFLHFIQKILLYFF